MSLLAFVLGRGARLARGDYIAPARVSSFLASVKKTVITLPLPGDPQPRAAVACFYLSHPSGRKNLASLMYLLCVSGAIAILVLLFLMVGERPPRVTTDCGSVEGVFDSQLQSFYFLVSD